MTDRHYYARYGNAMFLLAITRKIRDCGEILEEKGKKLSFYLMKESEERPVVYTYKIGMDVIDTLIREIDTLRSGLEKLKTQTSDKEQ